MSYKVEMNIEALKDVDTLSDWLRDNLSPAGARRYLDAMISEIRTLSLPHGVAQQEMGVCISYRRGHGCGRPYFARNSCAFMSKIKTAKTAVYIRINTPKICSV